MRISIISLLALLSVSACSSTYHPEYHPVTTTSYTETVSTPVNIQTAQAQPVHFVPAPPHTTVLPAAPPPPTPPDSFPW